MALEQPEQGYRVAIDPVLLAASVAAAAGERILDGGCGVGAAALCLAARIVDCAITGVESNPTYAALARENAAVNGVTARIDIAGEEFQAYARDHPGAFDQVMTNPPFHEPGRHTPSSNSGKAAAHGEESLDLKGWIGASWTALRTQGTLTLIHRADRVGNILAAFEGRFGAALIYPLWPRAGTEAKRVLISAIKGRRTLPRILPGLVLHRKDGAYTPEAEAILRDCGALDFTGPSR